MYHEHRSTDNDIVTELYTFYVDDSNKDTVLNFHVGLTNHTIEIMKNIKQIN